MRKILLLAFAIIVFIHNALYASTVSGIVRDSRTNEPVIGAIVKIAGSGKGTKSRLDGSYKINGVSEGTITINVSSAGYQAYDSTIVLRSDAPDVTIDIALVYRSVKGQGVTVTAKAEHGSESEAQLTERNSDQVVSAVSARAIEISPDINVANVSQRVAGVTMTRTTTGDAQYAIIRGMDKRYNYTSVNGIKIPSPDNKNSYVPLDIFPS
ncbi:MAG TPA: carboxypeptidase-like regulatory domain-containing protein, partial [Candidatus Kapabacteria bacterium]|nr:carboxypeptidase-like regulatory domain-containing protein [Candidatus Kapabacteria bacterium]